MKVPLFAIIATTSQAQQVPRLTVKDELEPRFGYDRNANDSLSLRTQNTPVTQTSAYDLVRP